MSAQSSSDIPSVDEIAALIARLRTLTEPGATSDPAERARFLADKDRLLDRISAASSRAEPRPPLRGRDNQHVAAAADTALDDTVRARAELGGYALVGPSARTWRTDPDTRRLLEPVSEAEHRTLRHLLGTEAVTTTEPAWIDTPDGQDVVSAVIPLADESDLDERGTWMDETAELGLTGAEGPPLDAGAALTAEEAAHELTDAGRGLAEARALVRGYLGQVSDQIGTSAHLWGLDDADLDAIRAGERARTTATVERPQDAVALSATAENHAVRDEGLAEDGADDNTADDNTAEDGAGGTGASRLHVPNAILNRAVQEDAPRHVDQVDDGPWDDYRTYTAGKAAAELVARGLPPDAATAAVQAYLDRVSGPRGDLDDADITHLTGADGPGSLPPAVPGWAELSARSRARARDADAEVQCRAQLAAWHATTHPADTATDTRDDGVDRGGFGREDGITP